MNTDVASLDAKPRGDATLVAMALAGLMCFHFCANVWWLREDHHVVRTDEEAHMLSAREYYDVLFQQPHDNPVLKLIAVGDIAPGYPAHPPLLPVLGALSVRAFSYTPDTIALTCTFIFVLALLGCYLLARTFMAPWPAWFAAFVVSMTPAIFASSRYFMTDFLAMALTIWAIYALVQSNGFRNTAWVFVFAVINGLAILTRTPAFLYYLIPCGYVVLAGLAGVWRGNAERRGSAFRLWLLNCVMTLVVSAGIFAPWYFHHLERFNTYWAEQHEAERGSPLAVDTTEEFVAAEYAFAQVTPETPAALKHFTQPPVPWMRYPTYVINNGMFLPLFLLALLGIPIALAAPRFRSRATFLLLLWVLGAWLLWSVLLKDSTARYALPVLPALSLFAAIAVLSPPWKGMRALTTAVLAAWLVFQYGNLTVRAYGDYARLEIPVEIDETGETASIGGQAVPFVDAWAMSFYHDPGLVLYKDTLTLSNAYGHLAAPTPMADNYKDRIFQAMTAHEKEHGAALPGGYANFLQLNLRGMEFDQRHYWPGENPYVTRDWLPEELPRRRFNSLGLRYDAEPLLTKLANADYVLYAIETSRPEEEARWVKIFTDRGFKRIEHFEMPRLGQVPPRNYGVLARDFSGALVEINDAEDLQELDVEGLYAFAMAPGFEEQPGELRAEVLRRFEALLEARGTQPYPLNESALYLWSGANKVEDGLYRFRFLFRVTGEFDRDWDLYFRGKVDDEFLHLLPAEERSKGIMTWDFSPTPPTTAWGGGGFPYVIITQQVRAAEGIHALELGFFKDGDVSGRPVRIPTFDFRDVR